MKAFEYRLAGASNDDAGARRFACALGPGPAEWPALVVEPEAFLTPAAERGSLRPVPLGGGVFDERFVVRCDDDAFASRLLDAPMREWLLASGESWGFEVIGRLVLAYRPVDGPVPASEALEALGGFLDRVPAAAGRRVRS